MDATHTKLEGRWCYFYWAIDKSGNLVDVMLSDVRDQAGAERFLKNVRQHFWMKSKTCSECRSFISFKIQKFEENFVED